MRRSHQGLWYVVPAGLVYVPLVTVPLVYSMVLSLHRWDGLAAEWQWVGLSHYVSLWHDRVAWQALGHNLALVAVSVLGQLPVALGLAWLVQRAGRWTGLARTALFLPYVLPTVVIALVWRLLVVEAAPALLGSTTWSLPVVMVAISWRFVGFHMVLLLAGLTAIDPELEEAARLDGATGWQVFRHVTLPLLRPVLAVCATLAVVGSLKYFDIVYVMTAGGPAHATELLATYMYKQGFEGNRLGYASAVAVTMTVLSLAATATVVRWARRKGES